MEILAHLAKMTTVKTILVVATMMKWSIYLANKCHQCFFPMLTVRKKCTSNYLEGPWKPILCSSSTSDVVKTSFALNIVCKLKDSLSF